MANEKLRGLIADVNPMEIAQHIEAGNLHVWCHAWRDAASSSLPSCDAVGAVHGYWIDSYSVDHIGRITEHGIDCSVCDSVFKAYRRDVVQHWKERFKVCPFCGSLMDGGNEDGNEA